MRIGISHIAAVAVILVRNSYSVIYYYMFVEDIARVGLPSGSHLIMGRNGDRRIYIIVRKRESLVQRGEGARRSYLNYQIVSRSRKEEDFQLKIVILSEGDLVPRVLQPRGPIAPIARAGSHGSWK